MSYPGSIIIERVDYNKLRFLTSTSASSITSEDYDLDTGKPKNNISNNADTDAFFLNIIENNLFERGNINEDFIYSYPKVLETDSLRDIQVTNETAIDVVFIKEGASMQNMFGYYMYYVDGNGDKKILSNAEDTQGYYYSPTVIYPYVFSETNDTTTLQRGNSRKLLGNLPNGNFQDICIGFFLVPHGWYAFKQSSPIDNDAILYSTVDFNRQYVPSEYQMVNDKIYSIYARAVSDEGHDLLFTAFEDVIVTGIDDLDYNDCVVGFTISDVTNIVDYNRYSNVNVPIKEIQNNLVFIDENGEFVRFDNSVYNIIDTNSHVFERHMCFSNIIDRDSTYTAYIDLLTNYRFQIEKVDENDDYKIVFRYLFRQNDLKNANKKKRRELYIFESKYNRHINDKVNTYKIVTNRNLKDPNYTEKYRLLDTVTNDEIVHLTDIVDLPVKIVESKFRVIGNGVMDCLKGKSHLPSKTSQIYKVYKNMSDDKGLVVNIKMDTHPDGYMSGTKNFVRYISFVVNTFEHIVIDLGNLNMYQEIDSNLVSINTVTSESIVVSDVVFNADQEIKLLVDLFRNDSGASYRTVTIDNRMTFYCIRFPNIKNNPTMIFLNTELFIEWNDRYNSTGGTYYNKQTVYPVYSFKSI